ncbi:phage integrase SAM-like domain-containing protein [Mucilaginibacter sp. KACC 22063]|uniref:phage integrase SAM-like domain-containing protein n=1 Tax=Mucilaginibacter sp. KACC 22063 TaxID=3025666 RepID=UPI003082547F
MKYETFKLKNLIYANITVEVFLWNHKPKDHQKPLNNNGVMKHIIRLKKMVNLALNLQWINNDPFATYKLKIKK